MLYLDPKEEVVMDYDRIAPGLYLGGHLNSCGPFDVVVLAAQEFQEKPRGRCRIIHAPFNDTHRPSREEVLTALKAAKKVRSELRHGRQVLVTCAAGINRSALIVALVLMMEGASARQAIRRIRARRRGTIIQPLSNPAFIQVLKKYEEVH
jgi:protein-tyrosine phosphatase